MCIASYLQRYSVLLFISDALGDPTIFTNALDNQYLPFVVNWDTMSNEEIDNMEMFWRTIQGGTNLGNYAYMFKVGIFEDEYAELRTIWSKKGGENCYELGHGIFDPANAQAVHDGCVKGGNTTRDKKAGKVGVWWRRLPLFQEFMKTVSANYFTLN
jgi:hypothetical protein